MIGHVNTHWVTVLLAAVALLLGAVSVEAKDDTFDVVVYGATPAGCAAAMAAADSGKSVLLIESTARPGGMLTNGLSHADFRTFEGLTGSYLKFTQRVQAYYVEKYGEGAPQTA